MIKENFETSLMNLEKIVAELESGQLSLEDSLERYKNGIDLIKHCNKLIDKAETEVVKLTKDFKENE